MVGGLSTTGDARLPQGPTGPVRPWAEPDPGERQARYTGAGLVLAMVVVGSTLTVAYTIRFYWGAFVAPRLRRFRSSGIELMRSARSRSQ